MQLEIKVALNFIISYLYNKLPRRRVNIFGEELERQLKNKYQGHWYPEKPYKGSGFRCIHIGEKVDLVVERAAEESGLDVQDVRSNLPQDLSVWIDPFEVSYQIGEKGLVKVLYVDENVSELDKEIRSSFNPEAQVFLPISEPGPASSESSSPSPCFGQPLSPSYTPCSTQSLTFTTASFAATKFGSTRMKSSSRGNNNNNNYSNNSSSSSSSSCSNSQLGHSSPTSALLHHSTPSMPSLYGPQQDASALSPDAEEFVFPGLQGPSRPPLGPLQYSRALKVLEAYGSLNDLNQPSLNLSLSNMQHSNQQTQPVLAN